MRILIVSDTHGMCENLDKVVKRVGEIDFLIHAGDVCGDEDHIRKVAGCECAMVSGNNDFLSRLPQNRMLLLEGHKIFLTHGHNERVYYGTDRLVYKALENGAEVAVYGHTHYPSVVHEEASGLWIVNPGSLSLPRQEGRRPSFVLMEIGKNSEIHFFLNYL